MEVHLILRAPIGRVSKDEVKLTHYPSGATLASGVGTC